MASFLSQELSSSDTLFKVDVFFEIIFLISMMLEFLTDYQPEQQGQKPVRNIKLIA